MEAQEDVEEKADADADAGEAASRCFGGGCGVQVLRGCRCLGGAGAGCRMQAMARWT